VTNLPHLVWLAPFALYLAATLCRGVPTLYWRLLLILIGLGGNILLLAGYDWALAALDRLQQGDAGRCLREHLAEACPNPYGLSEEASAPLHWEWAMVAYVLAVAGLYFVLHVAAQRMARRAARTGDWAEGDAPGLEP
jgi:hypothetical protein